MRYIKILMLIFSGMGFSSFAGQPEPEVDYVGIIEPILKENCFSCHNDQNLKGGIDLKTFFFGVDSHEGRIVKGGRVWTNVIKQIRLGNMPPDGEPQLSYEERETLVDGINKILSKSLNADNPGRAVIRRLSHNEYHFSILNLVGVDFDAKAKFPADGSGGAGFDNYSNTLYLTPLRMEQYYNAAEEIIDTAYNNKELWKEIVPHSYVETFWSRLLNWFKSLFSEKNYSNEPVVKAAEEAEKVIVPFASKAFRRFLSPEEKEKFLSLFKMVYEGTEEKNRYDLAIKETLKAVLISPKFLYRYVEEQPIDYPYPLSNFELASRLSYFLWSSSPDKELFEVAYRGNLHNPAVLKKQVKRMLKDPKTKRFSESFATQWFGISNLREINPVDPNRFPEFTPFLRYVLYQETVEYFHYVLTESKNFLDLINSNYTFLNEKLAEHYDIPGVKGDSLRKVVLKDRTRGGVMGMGSILASTSLPLRTSPVKRGQWVLEELLGTPAPPPPPDAGELPEEEAAAEDASIRELLVLHRSKPACQSCHEKMDPIGFGFENFDPVGRWRDSYGGEKPIIAWDTLGSGEPFNGPVELKKILVSKNDLFARVIAEKMFAYALGRNVDFTDELFIKSLVENLLENNFNTELFIMELVNSRPFRYAVNDKLEKYALNKN